MADNNLSDMENINDEEEKKEVKPGFNKEYLFTAIFGIAVGGILYFLIGL